MNILFSRIFFVFCACLLIPTLNAQDTVQFSGFGTFGVIKSDSDTLVFRNDFSINHRDDSNSNSVTALSNLGAQLDITFNRQWDAVAQWVYREQDKQSLDTLTSLAFVRYSPSSHWRFRAGRTAIDLFHLSQYRDIGIAYTWAKVPTEVYGYIPSRSIDGLDMTYSLQTGGVNLSAKLYAGEFEADYTSTSNSLVYFDDMIGTRLTAETFDWSFHLRHTQAKIRESNSTVAFVTQLIRSSEPLWPGAQTFADEVSVAGKDVQYSSVSGQYSFQNYTLMAEIAHITSDTRVIPSVRNGYLSLITHQGAHSFHITGSFSDASPYFFNETVFDEQALAPVIDIVERQLNSFATNQLTQSIGWRWDITESTALKVQWDYTRYKGRGSGLLGGEQTLTQRPDGDINHLIANWSFSFR